jgi:hypothetical protein
VEGEEPARTDEDLERVVKRFKSQNDILAFSDLAESDSPPLISFEGAAVRQISDGVFWLAMEHGTHGLLLAGSADPAIGSPVKSDGPSRLAQTQSQPSKLHSTSPIHTQARSVGRACHSPAA